MDRQQSEGGGHLRTDSKSAHSLQPARSSRQDKTKPNPRAREHKAHARKTTTKKKANAIPATENADEHVLLRLACLSLGNLLGPHLWLFIH